MRRAALALALVGIGACNSLLDVDNPGSVPAEALSDPALAPALAAAALQTLQCGVEQYDASVGMLSGEYLNANGFVDNHPWEWRGSVEIKGAPVPATATAADRGRGAGGRDPRGSGACEPTCRAAGRPPRCA
jgi:hypothetical protein